MTVLLTSAAEADITHILVDTLQNFGPRQVRVYATLIEQAIDRLASDAGDIGTVKRSELGQGVRSLHLDRVARRLGAASHVVYFLPRTDGEETTIFVLRILHHRMEPISRVHMPDAAQ